MPSPWRSVAQPLVTFVTTSERVWFVHAPVLQTPESHELMGLMTEEEELFEEARATRPMRLRQEASEEVARLVSVDWHCEERD